MSISVSFPAEMEPALRRQAAAAGQDVAAFVTDVVAERLAEDEKSVPKRRVSRAGFAERLAAWIKLFPVLDHPIDDSRESIYAGCGE
ncbi:MAG: hypothetical protein SH850_25735 [Planctomycetaceae bacterium]|nr:hypothetical protein [Planctomycetaceae bacterium]